MLQEESLLPVTPPRNGWESEQNGEEFRRSQNFQISSDSSPEWGGVLGGVYEDSSPEYGGAMIMDSYHRYHGKLFLDPKSPQKVIQNTRYIPCIFKVLKIINFFEFKKM